MRAKKQKISIFALFFIICFIVTGYVIHKWGFFEQIDFVKVLEEKFGNLEGLFWVANGIWSFLVANVFNFAKIYLDKRKENMEEMPRLNISVKSITHIKKTKRKNNDCEIMIGEGKCFVYVKAVMRNVGEGTIQACYINEQKLKISQISKGDNFNFCFRVNREDKDAFKDSYIIEIEFEDMFERYFKKVMKLKVDEEHHVAVLETIKKQRMKRRSNK